VEDQKNNENIDAQVAIYVPFKTISLLKKTFNLKDFETEAFIVSLIDKATTEHSSQGSAEVFTAEETKEIEDNLQGLGYI
jgi:hypothetical protein